MIREDKISNNNKNRILIAIEDSGYAYDMYKLYLDNNYTDKTFPDFTLLGVGGAENFYRNINRINDYDKYLFIYDNGADIVHLKSISKALESIRNNNKSAEIWLFTPNCFEEILLSFTLLDEYVKNNRTKPSYQLFKKLKNIVHGFSDSIDYFRYDVSIGSVENKIEDALAELTKGTVFEYKHPTKNQRNTNMSECWFKDCCEIDTESKQNAHIKNMRKLKQSCKPMKSNGITNKLELLTVNSLFGGYADIIT